MSDRPPWYQKIAVDLVDLLEEEGFLSFPYLPLKEIEAKIAHPFHWKDFSLSMGQMEWKNRENFFTGLGDMPVSIGVHASPLEGEIFWVMGREDLTKLISWFRDTSGNQIVADSPDLIKGIYRFMILQILDQLGKIAPLQQFSFKIVDKGQMGKTGYTIDLSLKKGDEALWGRLIFSHTLKTSYENHFAKAKSTLLDLATPSPVSLPISITAGSFEMTQEELSSLQEGDFVITHNATLHPDTEQGSLLLNLQEKPLFLLRYKDGKVTVAEEITNYSREVP